MSQVVLSQALVAGTMFCCGILLEFLHRAVAVCRERAASGRMLTAVQELLFWVAAGLVAARFLYFCNYGQPTFSAAVAFIGGTLAGRRLETLVISTK